jgi:hypothetical protein
MILKVTSRIARWGRLLFLPIFGCSRALLLVRNPPPPTKLLFSIGLLFFSTAQYSFALQLSTDSQVSTAGYYQLSWSGKASVFQLHESTTPDFRTFNIIYEGKDLARVMSGKPDGDYFYRLRTNRNNQPYTSNVVKVTVAHHPLKNAILFFSAGAIVFVSIIILVVKGNRKENN